MRENKPETHSVPPPQSQRTARQRRRFQAITHPLHSFTTHHRREQKDTTTTTNERCRGLSFGERVLQLVRVIVFDGLPRPVGEKRFREINSSKRTQQAQARKQPHKQNGTHAHGPNAPQQQQQQQQQRHTREWKTVGLSPWWKLANVCAASSLATHCLHN